MSGLKDIRTRIKSTKNTQKITSAMKLVSGAKLRKAQKNIEALRPYAKSVLKLIADIASTNRIEHKLLKEIKNPAKALVIVVSSDRGLCGAFNTNVSKKAFDFFQNKKADFDQLDLFFIGRRARDYFRRREVEGIETILNLAKDISYDMALSMSGKIQKQFSSGAYDEVYFIYNEFKSAISQSVEVEKIFPVDIESFSSFNETTEDLRFAKDLIFEPSAEKIIDELLVKHFAVQVYRCLSESVASEHGARMTAMESATKNAGELIDKLTLTYNKLRQASITNEIIEITSGAEAV